MFEHGATRRFSASDKETRASGETTDTTRVLLKDAPDGTAGDDRAAAC
jgi:hypothetical protein